MPAEISELFGCIGTEGIGREAKAALGSMQRLCDEASEQTLRESRGQLLQTLSLLCSSLEGVLHSSESK